MKHYEPIGLVAIKISNQPKSFKTRLIWALWPTVKSVSAALRNRRRKGGRNRRKGGNRRRKGGSRRRKSGTRRRRKGRRNRRRCG